MIAKAEWFSPRKFGWGLGIKSAYGIAYIVGVGAIFGFAASMQYALEYKAYILGTIFLFFLIDILSIMPKVYSKLDERQKLHELVAERNASFAGVTTLAVLIAYSLAAPSLSAPNNFTPTEYLAVALVVMAAAKGITLVMQERGGYA